jgi:hypothetical protein
LFQFLNPIWLFAAAAIIIPVAIHLWNIRPGKVLKVGSISLIAAASRKSSRSFKLLDVLLFIIRSLLLVVLALLLAIPLWQKKLQSTKVKGWVLLPKENLYQSYSKFKPHIDSLINTGYEFHYFNQGFAKSDLKQILAHPKDSIISLNANPVNYWGLINQLDTIVTPTLPLYVFTPNQSGYFTGQKPEVALNLHWQTYLPADSTSTWIQSAWFNSTNIVKITQGSSKPSGTIYSFATVKTGDQPNSAYSVNVNDGQATVSLKTGNQQPVTIDTTLLKIAIYTDNNVNDAEYLKAALQAVIQFTQRKIVIKQYADVNAIPIDQQWVFWLSEKPITSKLLQQSHNIFRYQKGKVNNSDSWVSNNTVFTTSQQQGQKIAVYKLLNAAPADYNTVWRDGFGHPVLNVQKQGQKNIYNFYSRFDPSWNDLVWSNEFPAWIMTLLIKDEPIPVKYDKRVLDQQQIMPVIINQTHNAIVKTIGFNNLSHYFWLILVLLFLAERWLATKTQNAVTNG